jgi:hypothetical protein
MSGCWKVRAVCVAAGLLLASGGVTVRAQAGLLLGLSGGRTLWIAPQGGAVEFMEIPDLIVPRRDGFWRVGVRTYCEWETLDDFNQEPGNSGSKKEPGDSANNGAYSTQDVWFAGPVSERPEARGFFEDDFRDLIACPKQLKDDDTCATDNYGVAFVTSEYISLVEQEEGMCPGNAHPSAGEAGIVGRLDDHAAARIAYSDMEGAGASAAFRDAADDAQVEHEVGYPQEAETLGKMRAKYPKWDSMTSQEKVAAVGETAEDFCGGDTNEQDWYFERDDGQWIAHSTVDLPHVCGDYLPFDLPFHAPFPAPFTGPISLDAIRKQVPDAYDAVWSPKKEMVVVLAGQIKVDKMTGERTSAHASLEVFLPHGQDLGKRVATLATGEATGPVMAEWATGPNVARWTAELTKIKAQGVVNPRLPESPKP